MVRVERSEESPPSATPEIPLPPHAAPPSHYVAPQYTPVGNPWSTGLFDCHEDEPNAVMTAFLPCITFGQIAEVMDQGQMTCFLGSFIYTLMMPALCSQWVMGSKYRQLLRMKYNLVEAPYEDVVSHIFCPCCSLCQEFRELQRRGLNPALGTQTEVSLFPHLDPSYHYSLYRVEWYPCTATSRDGKWTASSSPLSDHEYVEETDEFSSSCALFCLSFFSFPCVSLGNLFLLYPEICCLVINIEVPLKMSAL